MLDSFSAFSAPLREPLFVVVGAVRPHPSITTLLPWSPLMNRIFSIGQPFPFQDEIYAFTEPYSRAKPRVLLSIDYPNSPDVVKAEETLAG